MNKSSPYYDDLIEENEWNRDKMIRWVISVEIFFFFNHLIGDFSRFSGLLNAFAFFLQRIVDRLIFHYLLILEGYWELLTAYPVKLVCAYLEWFQRRILISWLLLGIWNGSLSRENTKMNLEGNIYLQYCSFAVPLSKSHLLPDQKSALLRSFCPQRPFTGILGRISHARG